MCGIAQGKATDENVFLTLKSFFIFWNPTGQSVWLAKFSHNSECCGQSQILSHAKGLKSMPIFLHQRFPKIPWRKLLLLSLLLAGNQWWSWNPKLQQVGPVLSTSPPWPGAGTTFPWHSWLHPALPWAPLAWVHWCCWFLESAAAIGAELGRSQQRWDKSRAPGPHAVLQLGVLYLLSWNLKGKRETSDPPNPYQQIESQLVQITSMSLDWIPDKTMAPRSWNGSNTQKQHRK